MVSGFTTSAFWWFRDSEHSAAPSAFLASAAASSDLVHQILPPRLQSATLLYVPEATELWAQGHDHPPPDDEASHCQKNWDIPRVSAVAEDLLQNAVDARSRAHLLATVLCMKRAKKYLFCYKALMHIQPSIVLLPGNVYPLDLLIAR